MIEGLAVRIGPEVVITDAVVIAATGCGARDPSGGPASELRWSIAQAARRSLVVGIRAWQERNA